MPSRQAVEQPECEREKTYTNWWNRHFSTLKNDVIVVYITFVAHFFLDRLFVLFFALLHPNSPDFDPLQVALAAGINFS